MERREVDLFSPISNSSLESGMGALRHFGIRGGKGATTLEAGERW